MAADTSRRLNTSENTLLEADQREDSPLLSDSSTSTDGIQEDNVDATTIYAQILEEHLPWHKRPSAFWLLPFYGMAAVSGGMLMAALSQFEVTLLCREYMNRYPPSNSTILAATGAATHLLNTMTQSPSSKLMGEVNVFSPPIECQVPEIHAFTAKALAVMQVLGGICATLSIGYWASLSDKHGRVKLMLLGGVSNLIMLGCLAIMGKWWDQVGFPLLYIMATLGGLLGGIGLSATMGMAYAADCTAVSKRSLIFSWLHASLFLGLMIGQPIGGVLANKMGFMTLIQICLVATVISGGFLVFLLPESLPSKQSPRIRRLYEEAIGPKAVQAAASSKRSQENVAWHSHVVRSLRFFKPNGNNTNFIILAAISFLQTLALNGTFSVLILYTNKVFNWTELEDGILLSMSSFVRLISLLILLPVLVHSFHKWNNKKRGALAAGPQAHDGPNKKDDLINASSSSSTHPWAAAERQDRNDINTNDIIGDHPDRILVGLNDPTVASSIEHLGEAALNLSDDEESFQERRRRQSSATLLNSTKPNYSSISSSSNSAPASRKQSVGSEPSQTSQAEQQKKLENTRDALKLDTWIIRLGFLINSTTYIGYGIATEPWMFYLWSSLHAISIIAAPSLKSLITSQVEPSQFGAVLGAVQVLDSMSGILSPIVISWVYALTVGTMPEFVWYTCAALTGICTILSFMIRQRLFGRRASNA
ncbi:hypothetical protein KI688_002431 [Linnemannia hyalina]|uniref:MFS general substrate transporter n=1 Tax=Linnemannia hyalina TaxID=64524 RepID=A0A9P8BR55_9FUNG|nr:hypothetical protein KI688_002431 [Linnemannia hyalina]